MGREDQVCEFSDGLYLNAGPARLPHHHHTILGYARTLGVPIEIFVNQNRSARSEINGHVFTNRQLAYDTRGRFIELLAKATFLTHIFDEVDVPDLPAPPARMASASVP